jgi:hypothetical protein
MFLEDDLSKEAFLFGAHSISHYSRHPGGYLIIPLLEGWILQSPRLENSSLVVGKVNPNTTYY